MIEARQICLVVAATLLLGACAVPRSTASFGDVKSSAADGGIRFVPVSAATIPPSSTSDTSFPAAFGQQPELSVDRLGPGDLVHVRIFEPGSPSVFSTVNGDLGENPVDENGNLFIPHAGTVPVEGLTLPEARRAVTQRLRTVVRDPQVDVRLAQTKSRLVSVQGNASKPGTYPIQRGRTSLGELLGEVIPDLESPEMVRVTVRRDGRSGTVRLAEILRKPALDIALRPGDAVVLDKLDETVTVLGAAGLQGQVPITRRDFSVIDVIGAARGLNDDAANPRAVFLVRPQPGGTTPTVYHFEMQRPETVALASRFPVHDNDAVLISNAPYTNVRKVLQAFSQSLGTARSAVTVAP